MKKSIRGEVPKEYLEDTLQMLLVRGRNLLYSEIPELNSEEAIYIDLDAKAKEDKEIITKLVSQSREVMYDFLDKERIDTKNIFTPALLFEKLFVFINDSKIELFKLNEMYKNLFREESLEKLNLLIKDEDVWLSSLDLAEIAGKEHRNVIRDINRDVIDGVEDNLRNLRTVLKFEPGSQKKLIKEKR